MDYIRILNFKHKYNRAAKRFVRAFEQYHGGISIFERDCAESANGCVCKHITKFYPETAGTPILYWIIKDSDLKKFEGFKEIILEESLSEKGDECHRDIKNVTKNQADKFFKTFFQPDSNCFFICIKDKAIRLSGEDYSGLENYIQNLS